ncbi:RagB/SusD family nutrient uptake outer membrane protein [Sphingobacterium shayense]|uniref:RagB/SusD family nutrient uptake outer membrane protein n=1 Tax=Sphingobacterium shayense TaxID=626343 RepID=UPI0015570882|nr:RagB/SusD family nutrient uptake outer membrane protein [Sphingobacterium shayense]NQD72752.1 RagB/SusD family nutrient uptake outer membrane protein [Sphingobacterium shayense]
MKRNIFAAIVLAIACSCSQDLNLTPTNDITADVAYGTPEGYKNALAKVYGSFAVTSGKGPGDSDLGGIDAGTSDFLRLYWNAQELASDEGICAWLGDPGVADLNYLTWNSSHIMLRGLYTRSLYHITVINEFLRESTDDKLAARGITGNDAEQIAIYRAEARFLRAYQYWVLMDLFGNPPFITEENEIGKTPPIQITRTDLFSFVENELKDVETLLPEARQNEYARADKGAAWALLSRLYLNAEVYTGQAKYTEAINYASKVIDAGYSLKANYAHLFTADNNINNSEIIMPIAYDGQQTQNNGGTTFLINSSVHSSMTPSDFGIPSGGWGGNRSRATLPAVFEDPTGGTDKRAMFFGSNPNIEDPSVFTEGLAITKFTNLTSTGENGRSVNGTFCSTDFPLFRLAEQYLNYAEAVMRGGTGGTNAQALTYLNLLRERAYGNTSGNLSTLSLDIVLEERSKELYWEAFRRTDLIRFGKYTSGSYLWPFKGGVAIGKEVEDYRTLFPLPAADLISNPNLVQNPGY